VINHRCRRAFTLIELLVVIAIIAILAAILFPVFARARKQARKATCASNMKQIGLSVLMYAQDYDERFPPHYDCIRRGQWGDIDVEVAAILAPYIKQGMRTDAATNLQLGTGIWLCPEDHVLGGPLGSARQAKKQERRTSYWYTIWLSSAPMSAITKDPTKCVLICDDWIDTHTTASEPRALNACFSDGHVKWVGYPEPFLTYEYQYSGYNTAKQFVRRADEPVYNPNNL
jgi:prepilin-type N-terminal cleavage/methylation domain-containing protein